MSTGQSMRVANATGRIHGTAEIPSRRHSGSDWLAIQAVDTSTCVGLVSRSTTTDAWLAFGGDDSIRTGE